MGHLKYNLENPSNRLVAIILKLILPMLAIGGEINTCKTENKDIVPKTTELFLENGINLYLL